MPKKRGAPPGNTNALKHGYYSPRYAPTHAQALTDRTGILAQVRFLRAYIVHVKTLSDQMGRCQDQVSLLRVLNLSLASLHHLIRLYHHMPGTTDDKDLTRLSLLKNISDVLTTIEDPPSTTPTVDPSDHPPHTPSTTSSQNS